MMIYFQCALRVMAKTGTLNYAMTKNMPGIDDKTKYNRRHLTKTKQYV